MSNDPGIELGLGLGQDRWVRVRKIGIVDEAKTIENSFEEVVRRAQCSAVVWLVVWSEGMAGQKRRMAGKERSGGF